MTSRRITQIIICLTVAVAILVPALTLFNVGDYLYCSLNEAANQKMIIEVLILAGIIGAVSFLIKQRKKRLIILAALVLAFSYIHSMLLPVVLTLFYFLAVASMGNVVTGISAVIILEGILSLAGLGTPKKLGAAVLIIAILYLLYRTLIRKEKAVSFGLQQDTDKWQLLVNAVVLLVVLVQIGRATVAVKDYDSLWYGLRSEHVLAPGGDIFEDLGLVGMVYTYSKGYEILTLPLSPLASYAYIPIFNTCLFLVGLAATWKIVKTMCVRQDEQIISSQNSKCSILLSDKAAYLAVIITAVIPGIVNMCVSAKPDMVTWMLQLIMIERFFAFVKTGKGKTRLNIFLEILAAYLLSLTMKPTAVIFSTALAGMMLIWWIIDVISSKSQKIDSGNSKARADVSKNNTQNISCVLSKTSRKKNAISISAIISAATALVSLIIVWARTIKLTGVPFTSVFTGLLTAIGFDLKYPFSSRAIPQSYQDAPAITVVAKRVTRMLLSPEGRDMGHVSIAWSGSIMLVLAVVIIICIVMLIIAGSKKDSGVNGKRANAGDAEVNGRDKITGAAAILFIPYAILCAVTLAMLYQVDGNYYMTFYSIAVIAAMWLTYFAVHADAGACASVGVDDDVNMRTLNSSEVISQEKTWHKAPVAATIATVVILVFQFFIMLLTNWASVAGFTPIAFNKLYYSNESDNRAALTAQASPEAVAAGTTIYDMLAADPEARVMAVAEHPFCLQFKCVVQSYNDVTAPWGNVELVDSTDQFVDYLHFAGVDYIYADEEFLTREECEWRKGMLEEMAVRGLMYDYVREGNTYLARLK